MSKAWNKRIKTYTAEQIAWRFRSKDASRANMCLPMVHTDERRIWATNGYFAVILDCPKPGHGGRWIDDKGRIIIMEARQPPPSIFDSHAGGPPVELDMRIADLDGLERGKVEFDVDEVALKLWTPLRAEQPRRLRIDVAYLSTVVRAYRDQGADKVELSRSVDPYGPASIKARGLEAMSALVMPLR